MKHKYSIILYVLFFSFVFFVTFVTEKAEGNTNPQSNLRYSITVTKFQNEAGWRGRWNIGDGFTTIMTDALNESDHFIVLGDAEMRTEAMIEQDFAQSGRTAQGSRAPQIGRMTPAQLLVRGSITNVQETKGGGGRISLHGVRLGGTSEQSEVNITIYLVDSETGQVKASTNVAGISNRRGVNIGYYGPRLGGARGDMGGFLNDNVGKACQDAVVQAIDFLVSQLDDIQWQGTVMLADEKRIIINRGGREGVTEGMCFKVGYEERLFDPDTGELLHVSLSKAGEIEIYEVHEKISYARPIKGKDNIEKGMVILP